MKNRYTKRTRAAGGVAVPCTSNPLELGSYPAAGFWAVKLPFASGVEVWVLRNRNLRTVSGWEQSSTK